MSTDAAVRRDSLQDDPEVDLREQVRKWRARWKLLLAFILGGMALAFIYTKMQPNIYESKASLYVKSTSSTAGLLADLPIGLSQGSSGSGYIIALLKSETMYRRVIVQLNLLQSHAFADRRVCNIPSAVEELSRSAMVHEEKDGTISLIVRSRSPELSAKIANAMVGNLGTMVITVSKKKTDFIQGKMTGTLRDLEKAENDLMIFQKRNSIASIDDQTKAMITELSELDSKLVELDVQQQDIRSQLANSGDLNDLVGLEVELKSLESSRSFLENKRTDLQKKLETLPQMGLEYMRLQRRVASLTKTYELLLQQYEMESISQRGEDGDYQIIDKAHPNKQKVAPSAARNAVLGGMIGLMVSMGLASFMSNPKGAYKKRHA
ncbi:MAG: GNVR domain-containing protein [Armatimonadota bacterium]